MNITEYRRSIHALALDRDHSDAQSISLLINTAKLLTSQRHPVHAEQAKRDGESKKHFTRCQCMVCCIYETEGIAGIAMPSRYARTL